MSIKEVQNQVCGATGCENVSTKKILFSLGFSANFCDNCAEGIVNDNIGTEMEVSDDGQ